MAADGRKEGAGAASWSPPPVRTATTAQDLDPVLARCAGVPVLGLRLVDPPEGKDPWVALAPADSSGALVDDAVTVAPLALVASGGTDPFSGARTPYVVVAGGKAVAAELARVGRTLGRFGDVRVAAHLLREGTGALPRDTLETLAPWVAIPSGWDLPMQDARQQRSRQAQLAHAQVLAMREMTRALRRLGLVRVFDLECRILPAVADMEAAGMPVDAAAYERVVEGWAAERATAADPARIARLDKLLSTYGHWARTFVDLDGRIRCTFDPLAADSGRFSCSDPNLQQVPTEATAPGLRACFRAPAGRTFVVADYAQIELRVAAQVAPCRRLRAVFAEGGDPHRTTAATLTGKPPKEVTSAERKLAKAINFGFLFGMGARAFRAYARSGYGLELSEGQARRAREAFFDTYPGIADWHRRTAAQGRRGEPVVVRTALGRRKRFPRGSFSLPVALNVPVQGTAAEGFKLAMVELHRRLPSVGGRGVLCVHDEYVAEVPEEVSEEARTLVVDAMVAGMAQVVPDVPIEVDAVVTPRWL